MWPSVIWRGGVEQGIRVSQTWATGGPAHTAHLKDRRLAVPNLALAEWPASHSHSDVVVTAFFCHSVAQSIADQTVQQRTRSGGRVQRRKGGLLRY